MLKKIINTIIKTEGGYVNHPVDKGGPTKYGITKQSLSNHLAREVDENDIKQLTKQEAFDIYEQHYYHYPKIDQLPQQLHHIMLDMSVNHGPRRAIKILQQELLDNNYSAGNADGIIGKKTIKTSQKAVNEQGDTLINKLIELRLLFYRHIIERNPSQKVFWSGWMNRAESFRPENNQDQA